MTFIKRITLIGAALAVSLPAFGQTLPTITTLSAAITTSGQRLIVLTSATGVSAPTSNQQPTTDLWIDKELMAVEAVSGTTITVRRGASGTRSAAHLSGAQVFIGPPQQFGSNPNEAGDPSGTCTRGASSATSVNPQIYLPYFNAATGNISDCLGGQWVNGVRTPLTGYRLSYPDPGDVAYTSINTSGTTVGATTVYCTEVNLPYNKLITGLAFLSGTTVTNDHRYSILYDSAGNALAHGALTGVVTATASIYQAFAFTTPFYAIGPARYFGCFQDSVGSDSVRMTITGTHDNFLTAGQTGATFGTVPALTVPTSFTTAVGPYLYVY